MVNFRFAQSFNFQVPSSKKFPKAGIQISNSKLRNRSAQFLRFGAWGFWGTWNLALGIFFLAARIANADQIFQLPTANHFLLEPGQEEKFFVGTVGKPWTSGCYGCVRSDGWQMHEGLDIRCLQRDKHGEPTDPVMSSADGTVVYISTKPSLSNYGNYIVIKHVVEGIEIYSLYAHLSAVAPGLKIGDAVKSGQVIATMGHTSNTRERITKDRAHVHFELNLLVNDRFAAWFKKTSPGERNDHGEWNGLNLLGLDPRLILLGQRDEGAKFSLVNFIQDQTPLFRVIVRKTDFPWLHRYAAFIKPNPVAQKEGVAGYELAVNFNGIPFELIPHAASEIKGKAKYQLLSVNESEYQKNHCRRLVAQRGGKWSLTPHGESALDLLTY
jgi:murein DD-endopeptidase MepM/ murein hydrolase activator NlpD